MSEPKDDPIAPFARAVIALFQEQLRDVRFPDVDHDALAALADEVIAAQLEVECVEAALQTARELVRERARSLTAQASRGLSYARIFAATNETLSARVAEIERLSPDSGAAVGAPAKKRGRPRKESAGRQLFTSGSAEEAAAEAAEAAGEEAAA